MDLTILHGRYNIAQYIYARVSNKQLKTAEEYESIAKKYHLRYINYDIVIQGIKNGKSVDEVEDLSTRPLVTIDTDED